MNIPLTITSFELVDDPTNLDDDGYPTIVSITLVVVGGGGEIRRVSCDPTEADMVALLARVGGVFTDDTEVSEDDADWLEWARKLADNANTITPTAGVELTGDLNPDTPEETIVESEVGEGVEVKTETATTVVAAPDAPPTLKRAGCKKPWEVKGWVDGKLLAVVKNHRNGEWGRCEYRVMCLPAGQYRLVYFAGNRSDLTTGTEWADAASMFRALLAQGDAKTRTDDHGRRQGTRMTINQFFGKRKKKAKKPTTTTTTTPTA